MEIARFTHWIPDYKPQRPLWNSNNKELNLTAIEYFSMFGKRVKVCIRIRNISANIFTGNSVGYTRAELDFNNTGYEMTDSVNIGFGPVDMRKAWKRDITHLLYKRWLNRPENSQYKHTFIIGEKSTEPKCFREYKRKVYLCADRVAGVLADKANKKLLQINNLSKEEHIDISRASFRCYPAERRGVYQKQLSTVYLISLRNNGEKGLYDMVLSDIKKYSQPMAREILDRIHDDNMLSFESYYNHISSIPEIYRKCKYNLRLPEDNYYQKLRYIPKNRYEWFMSLAVYGHIRSGNLSLGRRASNEHLPTENAVKFIKSSVKLWRVFKKLTHAKEHYSIQRLSQLLQYIADGVCMYDSLKDNDQGINFAEVSGSPSRMLKNAIYNHNQELRVDRLKIMDTPNKEMAKPSMELPEWIEKYRLKTHHDLVLAGKECRNCLGGYTDSNDIFIKKGYVCAQISNRDFSVVQVYDQHNTRTIHSEIMEKKLNHSLLTLRKVVEHKMRIA